MSLKYIAALGFHLILMMGILLAYLFASYKPNEFVLSWSLLPLVIQVVMFILISEAIVQLKIKPFGLTKRYNENQYLTRRFFRSFLLTGCVYGIMFTTGDSQILIVLMIGYYVLVTPIYRRFKKITLPK